MSNEVSLAELAQMRGEVLISMSCDKETCDSLHLTSLRFAATCKPEEVPHAAVLLKEALGKAGMHGSGKAKKPQQEEEGVITQEATEAGLAACRDAIGGSK